MMTCNIYNEEGHLVRKMTCGIRNEQGYSTELEEDEDAKGEPEDCFDIPPGQEVGQEDLDALEPMFFDEDATPAIDNIYTVTRKTTWLDTCNICNEEDHLARYLQHLQRGRPSGSRLSYLEMTGNIYTATKKVTWLV
ncbi:uncharacterized protein PV07_08675 [Cladophialophora immunda]|uniref:Uncharacterized protein n=1 Tax=Cladophialophora immunda TaxID=569365 RepID=A0A0D2CPQ0_9EURO|nr:uncharacterized protein PV07_08675 [Cladophialophora immunda]KIW25509.1 hypothetical protein PV07_08675 [Cladophialophora immunda]